MSDELLPHIIEIKADLADIKATARAHDQKAESLRADILSYRAGLEGWKKDTTDAIGSLKSEQDKAKGGVKILWFTVPVVSGGIGWLMRHWPGS